MTVASDACGGLVLSKVQGSIDSSSLVVGGIHQPMGRQV